MKLYIKSTSHVCIAGHECELKSATSVKSKVRKARVIRAYIAKNSSGLVFAHRIRISETDWKFPTTSTKFRHSSPVPPENPYNTVKMPKEIGDIKQVC